MKNKLWIPDITPTPNSIQHEICEQMQNEVKLDPGEGGCYGIECSHCILSSRHLSAFHLWTINGIPQSSQHDLF